MAWLEIIWLEISTEDVSRLGVAGLELWVKARLEDDARFNDIVCPEDGCRLDDIA